MKQFEISTDSTADLYKEEIEKLGIYVGHLQFTVSKNGNLEERVDDFKEKQEYIDFYNELKSGAVAKTSILNVETHVKVFTEMAKAGIKKALHITQSYGLSPTLDNANKAIEIVKQDYPDIDYRAIETRTTTIGEGMLVKIACDMRDEGKSLDETINFLQDIKMKMQHYIIVDDLMCLKRGGRISGPKAAIGTVFQIKPIIVFSKEGKLEIIKKEMGMRKAIMYAIKDLNKYTKNKDKFICQIVHTNNEKDALFLQDQLKKVWGIDAEIRLMGPIIGAHVGPGAVAFGFTSNEERPL